MKARIAYIAPVCTRQVRTALLFVVKKESQTPIGSIKATCDAKNGENVVPRIGMKHIKTYGYRKKCRSRNIRSAVTIPVKRCVIVTSPGSRLIARPGIPARCRGLDGIVHNHFDDFCLMIANARKFSSISNASSLPCASAMRSSRRNPWLSNISSYLSNQSINPAASNSGCG